jgi:hypothetical protein
MHKDTGSRKLTLKRETITPLQSEELDGVAGGVTPSIVVTVSRVTYISARSSQQCAQGAASAIANSFSISKLFGNK